MIKKNLLRFVSSKRPHTMKKINNSINTDSTIARSMNDNINTESTIARSMNNNINMDSTISRSMNARS